MSKNQQNSNSLADSKQERSIGIKKFNQNVVDSTG